MQGLLKTNILYISLWNIRVEKREHLKWGMTERVERERKNNNLHSENLISSHVT